MNVVKTSRRRCSSSWQCHQLEFIEAELQSPMKCVIATIREFVDVLCVYCFGSLHLWHMQLFDAQPSIGSALALIVRLFRIIIDYNATYDYG